MRKATSPSLPRKIDFFILAHVRNEPRPTKVPQVATARSRPRGSQLATSWQGSAPAATPNSAGCVRSSRSRRSRQIEAVQGAYMRGRALSARSRVCRRIEQSTVSGSRAGTVCCAPTPEQHHNTHADMYTHGQTATPADTSDTRLTGGLRGRHACCSLSGRLNLSQCGSPPAAGPPVASRSHGDGRSSIPSLSSTGSVVERTAAPPRSLHNRAVTQCRNM